MPAIFVNQGEIARVAGVSQATVSYALRGHAKIPETTKKKVLAAAKALGYQADPALSRMMSYLRGADKRRTLTKVAVLIPGRTEKDAMSDVRMRQMLDGVMAESRRHGFIVEVFWAKGVPGMIVSKLNRIVRTRGFDGVIVGPMPLGNDSFDFDFSGFACAAMGYSMRTPALHRAGPNHFRALREMLEAFRAKGVRRIGAILHRRHEDGSNNLLSSAIRLIQRDLPARDRLSILVTEEEEVALPQISTYLRKEKPEVLVGVGPLYFALLKLGYRIPHDLAFASIDCGQPPYEAAGLHLGYDLVGAAAANLLATQLSLGLRGVPEKPQVLMVDSVWKWGSTIGKYLDPQTR